MAKLKGVSTQIKTAIRRKFVPDETGVAFEGYTTKFVRYRMRVEYHALIDDPTIAAFGNHLNVHFEEF